MSTGPVTGPASTSTFPDPATLRPPEPAPEPTPLQRWAARTTSPGHRPPGIVVADAPHPEIEAALMTLAAVPLPCPAPAPLRVAFVRVHPDARRRGSASPAMPGSTSRPSRP
jgi:hypothetical protein